MIPIPGHNLTLNHDSGSKFNVELIPRVIIQRGIKTRGHNATGGPNFIRRRGRNSMTPCLWGRNSTWKIRWILSTARWIKTPRVEIQWGQNSILHRHYLYAAASSFTSNRSFPGLRNIIIQQLSSSYRVQFDCYTWKMICKPSASDTNYACLGLYCYKQNRSTEKCSKLKRSVDMTSSRKNGLKIKTNASPKWGRTRCPE